MTDEHIHGPVTSSAMPRPLAHWEATHCPAPWCGAPLMTRGLVTTCPESLSHYTRVLAGPEQPPRTRGEGIPKLRGRA